MGKTTISVETSVRDRLAALARRHGQPLGEELAALLDVAEVRDFWDRVTVGYGHAAGDPVDEEFPEYAQLGRGQQFVTPPDMRDDVPATVADQPAA